MLALSCAKFITPYFLVHEGGEDSKSAVLPSGAVLPGTAPIEHLPEDVPVSELSKVFFCNRVEVFERGGFPTWDILCTGGDYGHDAVGAARRQNL